MRTRVRAKRKPLSVGLALPLGSGAERRSSDLAAHVASSVTAVCSGENGLCADAGAERGSFQRAPGRRRRRRRSPARRNSTSTPLQARRSPRRRTSAGVCVQRQSLADQVVLTRARRSGRTRPALRTLWCGTGHSAEAAKEAGTSVRRPDDRRQPAAASREGGRAGLRPAQTSRLREQRRQDRDGRPLKLSLRELDPFFGADQPRLQQAADRITGMP